MTHFFWVAQFDFRDNLDRIELSVSNIWSGWPSDGSKLDFKPNFCLVNPKKPDLLFRLGWHLHRVQNLGQVAEVKYIPWAILDQIEIEYESLKASALTCWSLTNISSKSNHTYFKCLWSLNRSVLEFRKFRIWHE